jgi:hypothetical protein
MDGSAKEGQGDGPNPHERSLTASLAGLKPGLYSFQARPYSVHGGGHCGASELCFIQSRVWEPDSGYSWGFAHKPLRTGFHEM